MRARVRYFSAESLGGRGFTHDADSAQDGVHAQILLPRPLVRRPRSEAREVAALPAPQRRLAAGRPVGGR